MNEIGSKYPSKYPVWEEGPELLGCGAAFLSLIRGTNQGVLYAFQLQCLQEGCLPID